MGLKNIIFDKFIPINIIGKILLYRHNSPGLALMYHDVLPTENSLQAWTIVTVNDFEQQMIFMKNYFHVVPMQKAIKISKKSIASDKPFAVVTFDDGYLGNFTAVLPIIEKMEIPITIFVATAALENRTSFWYDRIISLLGCYPTVVEVNLGAHGLGKIYLNRSRNSQSRWKQMHKLLTALKTLSPSSREQVVNEILKVAPSSGQSPLAMMRIEDLAVCAASPWVTVGGHSHGHDILPQLSDSNLLTSLIENRRKLQDWTGQEVKHFSYPNGSFDARVIAAVKRTGFDSGMSTLQGWWSRNPNLYQLKRYGVGRFDSLGLFAARIAQLIH